MISFATEHYIEKRLAGFDRSVAFTLTKLAVYEQFVDRVYYSGGVSEKDRNALEYIVKNYAFTQNAELKFKKQKSPAAYAGAMV